MKISDLAIDRRTTIFVLLGLILLAGLYSYTTLPRESEPEIIIPFVNVSVSYPGVAPADMESLVTIPIESKMTGIPGIKEITSNSNEGLTSISIEFEPEEEISEALQRVRDKVDLARPDLPEEAEDPVITEINFSEVPIVYVNVTGAVGLAELTRIAESLEDEVEAVPGVLEVEVIGALEREIQIVADPVRMLHYGVSLTELIQLAQVENVNTPAGSMEVGGAKYSVRVPGEFRNAEDLRDLVVKRGENGVIYLRDIAEIRDGHKRIESYSRINGEPAVLLTVSKRSGENIIQVADAIRATVERKQETLPAAVKLLVTADESSRIRYDVEQLENSILTGLLLVVVVLFMFLGFLNAIFVALAIPISLLMTFSIMQVFGITLNMVTLFSLMVALGMLVDNGIVVVENIFRHKQEGLTRVQAARIGTEEVAGAIFASTITTIAAFFPMLFWPGIMGEFMSLLPKTVIIALCASLFVGLIVNPAAAAVFIRAKAQTPTEAARRHRVLDAYGAVLRLALRWRLVTITAAVMVMVVIIGVYAADWRIEFLPETEPDTARVQIDGPEGASVDMTDRLVRRIEELAAPHADAVDYVIASAGSRGANRQDGMPGGGGGGGQTSHIGEVTLDFPSESDQTVAPSIILQDLRAGVADLTGADIRIEQTDRGPVSGPPVNIELVGPDFDVLADLTRRVKAAIEDVPGLVDLDDDLDKGKPEVKVVVDRERANLANLNTQYIGAIVQTAVLGRKAGEYRVGDDEYDVTVLFPEMYREDLSLIENLAFVNPEGQAIPFSSVAHLEQGEGYGSIRRTDRKRMVVISGEAEGRGGPEVLAEVQERLAGFPMPAGYTLDYTGENEDIQDTTTFLFAAFVVALFLIALVLITQFNSILQPFVIMSSVILSLAGVFFGLLVFDMPFGVMMTGIGCVSLAGIVVNNAIVLVDFINQLRAKGLSVDEAIVEAGRTRFRPVMLTAVTTILGLIPLGAGFSFNFRKLQWEFGGEMNQYWGSMAVAIIFGLAFATVLTLVVVPTLYSLTTSVARVATSETADESAPAPFGSAEPVVK